MKQKAFIPLDVSLAGTNNVEASAGTGKTYNITTLYLRLLLESGLKVEQILVVTFTEAATAELRQRIRSRLTQAMLRLGTAAEQRNPDEELDALLARNHKAGQALALAIKSFDRASIFTIHGFCNRMLHDKAFESGVLFDTELMEDQQVLLDQILADYWASEIAQSDPLFVQYLKDKGYTLYHLMSLMKQATSQSERMIVPEYFQPPNPEAEYREKYEELRDCWQRDKKEIMEILHRTYPGLNKGSYKQEDLPLLLEKIAADLHSNKVLLPDKKSWTGKFASRAFKVNKGQEKPEHEFFQLCQDLCDMEGLFERKALWTRLDLVRYTREQLLIRKEQANLQSYDDMLTRLHQALGPGGNTDLATAIRKKYRAALIDEFQDTDTVQSEIFTRLFSGHEIPVFQIGDPKQSIYRFRGADVFSYIRAMKLAQNSYTMDINWRSDPSLIHGINFLFDPARLEDPFLSEDISYRKIEPRPGAQDSMTIDGTPVSGLRIEFIPKEQRDGKKTWAHENIQKIVARDVVELLNKQPTISEGGQTRTLEPGDMAVLVRTNKQASAIQTALRSYGIPSVRSGDDSVYNSPEARDLALVLAAVADPANSTRIRAALATRIMGLDAQGIFELQGEQGEGPRQWEEWIIRFRHWNRSWEESGFAYMFRRIMMCKPGTGALSNLARIIALSDGERRATNLMHLSELLQKEASEQNLGMDELLQHLEKKIASADSKTDESRLRLESDRQAIKIVTVFKAKGLEYPVVFCPYFWDGELKKSSGKDPCPYHDPHDGHRAKLDMGGGDINHHRQLEEQEIKAENMRLLYVGVTRAKHLCVVPWGFFTKSEHSPLALALFEARSKEDRDRLKKMSDHEALEHLLALENASQGAIHVRELELPLPEIQPPGPRDHDEENLFFSPPQRRMEKMLNTFSYSAMVGSHKKINPAQEQGLDHDEQVQQDEPIPGRPEAPHATIPTADIPRGGRVGNMFHTIFEELDFCFQDPIVLQTKAQEKLTAFGFDAEQLQQIVSKTVLDTLETHFDKQHEEFSLRNVPFNDTLRELHFWLPASLAGDDLVRAFEENPGPNMPSDYPKALADLDIHARQGFLQGYLDLIYRYQGQWYVVDYKSNFLGEHYPDYATAMLPEHMAASHYYLQYHLYTLALHRYLKYRLKDYDYDKHMGGVFYLFIRGMSPDRGPGHGVFSDKPSYELISALDRAMEDESRQVSP